MNSNEKKTPQYITFALIVNAAALALSLIVYRPFFETNDDAIFCLIAEGVHGIREPHLIVANIILGYIYKALYTILPAVRWHSVLQYVFMFLGYTSLTYIIQKISDPKGENGKGLVRGRLLAVLITVSTFYESYVSLQFSKTAAITCTAGYLILMYVLREKSINGNNAADAGINAGRVIKKAGTLRILAVAAYVLLIYGILLRSSSFKMVTLLMLPLGLYEFIALIMRERKISSKVVAFAVSFAALLCVFLAFDTINRLSYDDASGWGGFKKYHSATVKLIDRGYKFLDHDRYADLLEQNGISDNDAVMLMTWQFGDDDVWDTDKMLSIIGSFPGKQPDVEMLKGLAENIYNDIFVFDPCVIGFLLIIIAAFILLISGGEKAKTAIMICWIAMLAGIFVFFQYSGRWSHRVTAAAMLVLIPAMISLAVSAPFKESGEAINNGVLGGMTAFILIACMAVLLGNRFDYNDYRRSAQDYRGFYGDIAKDKETLYVADTFTFQDAYKYDVFKAYGKGSMDNFVTVGSWYLNSPITGTMLSAYGCDNPFDALVTGGKTGNVVLVDNMSSQEKLTYLNEHYGSFELEELPEEYGFKMYRVLKTAE
ncbi:MAG: hypothetical protein K6E63_00015 [Lachnospiraceae bacterium]|nr:hypothetical protein [Lachnospiraceae bacterium]